MAQLEKRQIALEKLVDELLKDQPRSQMVKELTQELGMPYSDDSVTQMNTVLKSMNSLLLQSSRRKGKELERQ